MTYALVIAVILVVVALSVASARAQIVAERPDRPSPQTAEMLRTLAKVEGKLRHLDRCDSQIREIDALPLPEEVLARMRAPVLRFREEVAEEVAEELRQMEADLQAGV